MAYIFSENLANLKITCRDHKVVQFVKFQCNPAILKYIFVILKFIAFFWPEMAASGEVEVAKDSNPAKKNPWNILSTPNNEPATSLADVMSEELAKDLVRKELNQLPTNVEANVEIPSEILFENENQDHVKETNDPDCHDDLLIAQMLQMQFDKEYDEGLRHEERHQNGSSKVTINYSKYKVNFNILYKQLI